MTRAWSLVIPVKPAEVAKSRLEGGDAALARAIALDTIAAAAQAERVLKVVVVTADRGLAAELAGIARVQVEIEEAAEGINAAIRRGLASLPDDGNRAAMLGDLPALTGPMLDEVLEAAEQFDLAVVADADDLGTTLITARAGHRLDPRFGGASLAAHRAAGHVLLAVPASSGLRRDVDTREQLRAAAALGLGPRTAALLSV